MKFKYKFVACDEELGMHEAVKSEYSVDFIAAMELRGFAFVCLNGNRGQRAELLNQPKFSGVLGPMYDGVRDGRPVIRYESREAYERLSA